MKRSLSLLLALALCMSLCPMSALALELGGAAAVEAVPQMEAAVEATVVEDVPEEPMGEKGEAVPEEAAAEAVAADGATSGSCGLNATWTLSGGTLTISGSGKMFNYSNGSSTPWYTHNSSIKNLVIGAGITNIGQYAFYGLGSLTGVTFSGSVTSIGERAFSYCDGLTGLTIPDSVVSIGSYAFSGCDNLLSVHLPAGLSEIALGLCSGCTGLTAISIPEGVSFVDSFAFHGCSNLQSASVPASVTTIESFAFGDCINLFDVYYAGTQGQWDRIYIGSFNDGLDNADIHFELRALTPPVVSVSILASSGKPVLKWDAVEEAAEYAVYRSDVSMSFARLSSVADTTYTDTSAKPGVTYHYKLQSLGGEVYTDSEFGNSVSCTCDYAQPTGLTVTGNSIGQPSLSWDAVDGATRYYIYRSSGSGENYSKVHTLSNGDAEPAVGGRVCYQDADAASGTTYFYKIQAAGSNAEADSALSAPVSFTYEADRPVLHVENQASSGKPRLSWNVVAGAVYYDVYSATDPEGPYRLLGNTYNTSFVNTSAVAGITYYYKVCALIGNGSYSEYSNVVSRLCHYARPVVRITNRASDGKPQLTWGAVDGATKYYVYRSVSSNGTYNYLGWTSGRSYTNISAEAGKTYYYKVKALGSVDAAASALSDYVFRTCGYARPEEFGLSCNAATGKPKLSWAAVKGAAGYEIWRATGKNETYTKIYTTTNSYFNNTSAEAGKTYYYKVRAIGSVSGVTSAFSSVEYITCDCARPAVGITCRPNTGKPRLSWEKVDGAVSYEVWRASSKNGTYYKQGSTNGTTYTNTSAVAGRTYYYKVYAVGSSSYSKSSASTVVNMTCDYAQPVVSISCNASTGKPKLSWSAVSGATRYEIWRATSRSGDYTKIYTTSDTYFNNTTAEVNKSYYYKVRAAGSSSYATSAYSSMVSVTCDCAKPVVTATTNSSGKPKLTWDAVDGAVKYEIWRSGYRNGTYTKIYTTSNTYFNNTSATSGYTYFYKVRAVGSSSYATSAYSSIVSAKCK